MPSSLKSFLAKLKKRHIIETFAGFIAGGWLFLEFVDRILIAHYELNKKWLDVSFVTLLGALLCIILWRWFSRTEKRPGNVKVEVLLVPLIILVALAIDLNLILQIAGIPGKRFLIGIIALCHGVVWVIFKLSQWASGLPETGKKEVEISRPAPARPEKSIVVLPFVNISPEEGQDYFCDGMTEEIITDLSCCHDLLVISRSSAMTLKGSLKTIKDIAKELNVRYALEGSVRKAGDDLRITAQLIDADTDVHLWADKFSGTLDNVFDIQEKVSRRIVDALKLKLMPAEEQWIARKPIPNVQAYEFYLKAQHEILVGTEDGLRRAFTYLENGLNIIGKNALLYAGLAFVYWQYVNLGIKGINQQEYISKAELNISKSLEIDPECGQAHLVLGLFNLIFWGNLQESVRQLKRALTVDPNALDALLMLALAYCEAGKTSAAWALVARCIKIDPFNPICYLHQSGVGFFEGRFDLALDSSSKAFKMAPEMPFTSFWRALMLAYNKRFNEAFSLVDQGAQATHQDIQTQLGLFMKYALKGEKEKINLLLTPEFISTAERDLQTSYNLATFYAKLGDNENSLNWLSNAVNRGFINYPMLFQLDPWLASIRSGPRFKKLMERVKYEWEHFEV